MTMDIYSLNYLHHLNQNIYSQFTDTKFYPYPNILVPQHKDKKVTQYHFRTKTQILYTALHSLWYKKDNERNKYIKIVPLNISEIFSEISLAYWIMDDGYFDSYGRAKTVILCTPRPEPSSAPPAPCSYFYLCSPCPVVHTPKGRDSKPRSRCHGSEG